MKTWYALYFYLAKIISHTEYLGYQRYVSILVDWSALYVHPLLAPTGSGKTVLFELAIMRLQGEADKSGQRMKCVYMAPTKVRDLIPKGRDRLSDLRKGSLLREIPRLEPQVQPTGDTMWATEQCCIPLPYPSKVVNLPETLCTSMGRVLGEMRNRHLLCTSVLLAHDLIINLKSRTSITTVSSLYWHCRARLTFSTCHDRERNGIAWRETGIKLPLAHTCILTDHLAGVITAGFYLRSSFSSLTRFIYWMSREAALWK